MLRAPLAKGYYLICVMCYSPLAVLGEGGLVFSCCGSPERAPHPLRWGELNWHRDKGQTPHSVRPLTLLAGGCSTSSQSIGTRHRQCVCEVLAWKWVEGGGPWAGIGNG